MAKCLGASAAQLEGKGGLSARGESASSGASTVPNLVTKISRDPSLIVRAANKIRDATLLHGEAFIQRGVPA
jgi:hypothetical protein